MFKKVMLPLSIIHSTSPLPTNNFRLAVRDILGGIDHLTEAERSMIESYLYDEVSSFPTVIFDLAKSQPEKFTLLISIGENLVCGYKLEAAHRFLDLHQESHAFNLTHFMNTTGHFDRSLFHKALKGTGWFSNDTEVHAVVTSVLARGDLTVLCNVYNANLIFFSIDGKVDTANWKIELNPVERPERPSIFNGLNMGGMFNMGMPNMGMDNGPANGASGQMLYEALGAYALTQVMPFNSSQHAAPQGLDLLNLIRHYLIEAHNRTGGLRVVDPNNMGQTRMPFDGRYREQDHMGYGQCASYGMPDPYGHRRQHLDALQPGMLNPSPLMQGNQYSFGSMNFMHMTPRHSTDGMPLLSGSFELKETVEETMANIRQALEEGAIARPAATFALFGATIVDGIARQLSFFGKERWETFTKVNPWIVVISPYVLLPDVLKAGVDVDKYNGWMLHSPIEPGRSLPAITISVSGARVARTEGAGYAESCLLAKKSVSLSFTFLVAKTADETIHRIHSKLRSHGVDVTRDSKWKQAFTEITQAVEDEMKKGTPAFEENTSLFFASGMISQMSAGLQAVLNREDYKGWVIHTPQPDRGVSPMTFIY